MSDIQIIMNYNSKHTLGWSQDASNFNELKKVIQIFDNKSGFHKKLRDDLIPGLIKDKDLADTFRTELNKDPVKIQYCFLTGTHSKPRALSPCSGIIQAAVPGQKRPYLSDWAADSYLRWAHLCGFIRYNGNDDTFEITETGKSLSQSKNGSQEEKDIFVTALLRYPPVGRILQLLSGGKHLTKFELGQHLGFIGEDGFTTLPQNILLSSLALTKSLKDKNKMKSDWDGSSDKYARQICSWLETLGLVCQAPKFFKVSDGKTTSTEEIGQAYKITPAGLKAYRRVRGINKAKKEPKNVYWEMLCTKGKDRNYIRNRRAYILKFLSDSNRSVSIEKILEKLNDLKIKESESTIVDDLNGLVNIGLMIKKTSTGYLLKEDIQNLVIPDFNTYVAAKSDLSVLKDSCRKYMTIIPHDYLSLIDLAFNGKTNRLFEMKVIDLFVSQCGYSGKHLGGSLRPDGVIYTESLKDNYGSIVDTKAYGKGYGMPKGQADKMDRYVKENIKRDEKLNPNKWWEEFPDILSKYSFMFVSGKFIGNVNRQLQYIANDTGVNGGAINITALLYLAEDIKSNKVSLDQVYDIITPNTEIVYSPTAP